jgi:hypothetical protein
MSAANHVIRTLIVAVYQFFGLPLSVTIGGFLSIVWKAKYPVVIAVGFVLTNWIAWYQNEIEFWPITWSYTGRGNLTKPIFVTTAVVSMLQLISERSLIETDSASYKPYFDYLQTRIAFAVGVNCFVWLAIINGTDPVSKFWHNLLSAGCAVSFVVYANILICQSAYYKLPRWSTPLSGWPMLYHRSTFLPIMAGLFAAEKYGLYFHKNQLPMAESFPREAVAVFQWSQLFLAVCVVAYQHWRTARLNVRRVRISVGDSLFVFGS